MLEGQIGDFFYSCMKSPFFTRKQTKLKERNQQTQKCMLSFVVTLAPNK